MPVAAAGRREERGQVIVMFTLGVVAILLMAGLVFDAAHALARRRQLQDAGDAAALAAANVIQTGTPRGCAASGTPRASVVNAAVAMVQTNIPGFAAGDIAVTCTGSNNDTVAVRLTDRTPGFFARLAGISGFNVATSSSAINGQITGVRYSIVQLDPGNPTWPNGRRGCPSALISGGPTILLEGSMMINSACTAADGGPLGTNGNSATVQLLNGATIRMVGQYVPSTLTITPAPVSGQPAVRDPLWNIPALSLASLPVRQTTKLTLSGSATALDPGVYRGGIEMKNSAVAYLRPGIYVMDGGGFSMGAQNKVYTIPAAASSTTDATWTADCLSTNCGSVIVNTGITRSSDQISVGAGATLKLRPYKSTLDPSSIAEPMYDNLLLWQDKYPVPTSSTPQPVVQLSGGGTVDISGTIYAPSALVLMTGGSGGSGGSSTDLTLQFITWDIQIQGNATFRFYYRDNAFARPTDYGLVQ